MTERRNPELIDLEAIAEEYPFLKDDGGRGVLRPMFHNLTPMEINLMLAALPINEQDAKLPIYRTVIPDLDEIVTCNKDADPEGLI